MEKCSILPLRLAEIDSRPRLDCKDFGSRAGERCQITACHTIWFEIPACTIGDGQYTMPWLQRE